MDYLRQGIHLRGYAQKNPKQEYKREAFEMFSGMLESIKREVISDLTKVQVRPEAMEVQHQQVPDNMEFKHDEFEGFGDSGEAGGEQQGTAEHQPFVRSGRKIGRNEPCPCGSGKKYKQCHGKL
jgi:preprotein translocase subunit SecA